MNLKEAQEKLTAKDYREALVNIELRDVHLKELNCLLHSRNVSSSANINFQDETSEIKIVEDKATVEHRYTVKVTSGEKDIFDVTATYILIYELKKTLPEEFFVIYKNISLPVHTYPFFRELVSSISTKMGLPNLIIPLRKDLFSK